MWEHFEHQADMGVRGVGNTRDEAFEQVALALTAVVVPLESIEARASVRVTCAGDDQELLLLDWLAAVVYQMSANRMVFSGFSVRIDDSGLDAELRGEPLDLKRHQPGVEVKAATATELHVGQRPDGRWVAQCVVDV